MGTTFLGCVLTGLVAADPEPAKPITPERVQELIKKLEEPTRGTRDPKQGPPDGPPPQFGYRFHYGPIYQLTKAGEAARPAVLALVADRTKPGQARAQAALVLVGWLKGKGAKQELDPQVLTALKDALKDKDPALRWGAVQDLWLYGAAFVQEDFPIRQKSLPDLKLDRDSMHFSDAAMDGLLPEVIALVGDEHPQVAVKAAAAIWSFGRPKPCTAELLAALKRKEPEVRATVARTLTRVAKGDPEAVSAVIGLLDPEQPIEIYGAIIHSVGQFGPDAKAAVPKLIEAVRVNRKDDGLYSFHDTAVQALGKIGPDAKAAVPVLLECLDTKYYHGDNKTRHYVGSREEVLVALDRIAPEAAKKAREEEKRRHEEAARWWEEQSRPPRGPLPPPVGKP